jgi:hypothetical protein
MSNVQWSRVWQQAHVEIRGPSLALSWLPLAEIRELLAAGGSTAHEVTLGPSWTRRGRHLGELDQFDQVLAVLETVIDLNHLVAEGLLRLTMESDLRIFRPMSHAERQDSRSGSSIEPGAQR